MPFIRLAFLAVLVVLAGPSVAQGPVAPSAEEEALLAEARYIFRDLVEADREAAAAALVALVVIPRDPPRAGAEWVNLAFTGVGLLQVAWGEVIWRVENGPAGLAVAATAAVPERGLGLPLTIARMVGGDAAFTVRATVAPTTWEGAPVRAFALTVSSRVVINNRDVADGRVIGPGLVAANLAAPQGLARLKDLAQSEAIGLGLTYEGGQEITFALALGNTGRAAFAQFFAAWAIAP